MLVGMLDLASKNSRAQIFGPVETDRAKKLLLGGIPTNPVAAIFYQNYKLSKIIVRNHKNGSQYLTTKKPIKYYQDQRKNSNLSILNLDP